jgi:hypothetical protein
MPKSGWDRVIDNSSQEVVTMPQPPHFEEVPLGKLIIDPGYQRELIEPHLKKIREDFEEAQLGVLEVSRRNATEYAVFDGQHRLVVLREREREMVGCIVHSGLSPEQEADLFRKLQDNRRPLTPLDKYKSRLFAGEPIAKGIKVITDDLGWKIGTGPGRLQSIVVAERVYRRGNLYNTLEIMGIWAGDAKVVEGSLIDGVSRFLDLFPEADMKRVRTQWMNVSPTVIIRRSAEFMASAHSSKAYGVLEVLRDLYTSREFRLPTVQQAQQERIGSGTRYRRLTGTEVRDAILVLHDKKAKAGVDPAYWTIDELREELGGVSRPALTKRGSHIDQFLERGMVRRSKDGQYGSHRYLYIPPDQQSPRRRPRGSSDTTRRNGGSAPVPYTGKPEQRTGGQNLAQRQKARRGRKIVQK